MQRRHVIAAAAALCAGARAWAAPGDARFLLVFLRGGYDALTLLAPAGSFYREARPTLALPWNGDGARPLDADWALHPRVHEALHPLLQAREIAFVPFAGTHDSSRSHFENSGTWKMRIMSAAHSASSVPLHRPIVGTPTFVQPGMALTHIS